MKHTPNFTADDLRKLLDYDPHTGVITRKTRWGSKGPGSVPGGISPQGYRQIGVYGRTYPAHRLAWLLTYGVWPADDIDHINRNRDDNRITNLRLATRSENLHNTGAQPNNTSGHKGVNWHKRACKWEARICVHRKQKHLGFYANIEDAINARRAAENARPNPSFPPPAK